MGDLTYKPGDLDSDVARAAGTLEVMTLPKGLSFKVTVKCDSKLAKEVETDKLLAQDLWLGVGAIYKDLVGRIGTNLKNTDRGAIQLRNAKDGEKLKKLLEVVNRGIVEATKIAEAAAEREIQKNFDALTKKRKEYAKYKIKIVVTISSAAAGLAISIGLLAATGFSGGASGVLGIIAMAKSVAVIATEVASAAQTVEQTLGTLQTNIDIINTIWGKSKAKMARAHTNEVLAATVKEFLGVPMPSAKQVDGLWGTASMKFKGLDVKTHDMAKKVTQMMLDSAAMQKAFLDKANEKLKRHPDPQALQKYGPQVIGNLQKAVKPGNDAIKAVMQGIATNIDRIKKAKVEMDRLEPLVAQITAVRTANKFTENAYKVLDNSLSVANNVLLGAMSGNGIVEGANNIAANVAPVVGLFAYDKISAVVFADGDLKKALW